MKKVEITVDEKAAVSMTAEGLAGFEIIGVLDMIKDNMLRGNYNNQARIAANNYAVIILQGMKIDESDGLAPEWNERIDAEIAKLKGVSDGD